MVEKGVIRSVIEWSGARTAPFWRLRRRLAEVRRAGNEETAAKKQSHGQTLELLRRWFIEDKGESHRGTWDNDRAASEWLEVHAEAVAKSQGSQKRIRSPSSCSSVVVENLRVLRRDSAIQRFKKLLDQSPDMIHEAGMHLVQKMSASKKAEFLEALKDLKTPARTPAKTPEGSSEEGDE